jgi:hypothetical protein
MHLSRLSSASGARLPGMRHVPSASSRPGPAAGRLTAAPLSTLRLAPVLGSALLAVALAWPPAACGAAPRAGANTAAPPAGVGSAPKTAADSAPQEQVLDVTLVPAGPAPRPNQAPQARRIPGLAAGAAARRGAAGSGSLSWRGWLAAAMAAAAAAGVALWLRRRPRRCTSCRAAMRRLGREEAFATLDMAERTEQLVGDVRYEVWHCIACGAVEKRGKARDLSGAEAHAAAAPVGSAAFLRRRARAGLSIWSPPSPPPAHGVWPGISAASPAAPAARKRDVARAGDRPAAAGQPRPADG